MALSKTLLKSEIKLVYEAAKEIEDQDQALEFVAEGIASAIDKYIRAAVVTISPGIPVSTSAPATGSTTGPGVGSLS